MGSPTQDQKAKPKTQPARQTADPAHQTRSDDIQTLLSLAEYCEQAAVSQECEVILAASDIAAHAFQFRLKLQWPAARAFMAERCELGDALGAVLSIIPADGTYSLSRRPDGAHVAIVGLRKGRSMHSQLGALTPALALMSAVLRALTVA